MTNNTNNIKDINAYINIYTNNLNKNFEIKDLEQSPEEKITHQHQQQIKTLQKYHKLIAHLPAEIPPPRSEKFYKKSHTVGTPRLITGKVRRAKKI